LKLPVTPVPCPRCGRPLPHATLDGLCPACLLRQALATQAGSVTFTTGSAASAGIATERALLTSSLSTSAWTLVTLMADDEEYVTYVAREHEADDARLAQLVVRKAHVPPAEMPDARKHLRRRLDALRQLRFPGLAPVLDGGLTDEGHPFLVTAFVMAAPLADLDAPRAPHEMSRQLLDQAGAALRALHGAGLAHGRVRASTILVRRTAGGATAVVTGFAPLDRLPSLSAGIADDLQQLQRLASTLRV
jgi:hypothetical protein